MTRRIGAGGRQVAHILRVFKATSQSGWMVLETLSVSHGKASAYLLVIDLLRNYFQTAIEDDERIRREKVKGRNASEIDVGRTSWMRGNSENRTTSRATIHRKSLQRDWAAGWH
jgi:hypothetical protein